MRASDITSLSEYRKRLREHHNRLKETGRPLFITSNGETDAVVLSPKSYDDLRDKIELLESVAAVERGVLEMEAGKSRPAREALRDLAARHGLVLDR